MIKPGVEENTPPKYAPVPLMITGWVDAKVEQNGEPEYAILTVGAGVIVIGNVLETTAGHPPEAGIVYITLYVPAPLPFGVIAPVLTLIANPPGDAEYVPPVYAPVPVNVTGCEVASVMQNVLLVYEIVALG